MLVALFSSMAIAAEPTQPTGRWVVDFADARCVASRNYGAESLVLKASPMGDIVQLALVEAGGYAEPTQLDAELQAGSAEPIRTTVLIWGRDGGQRQRISAINLRTEDFQRIASADRLRIRVGKSERTLATPGMNGLVAVMKDCVTDLQSIWVPETEEGRKARANLASFFRDSDFPRQAVDENRSGTTAFALLVDEKGRVADCTVTSTSGQAVLDVQACAILTQRARFRPGKDAEGKPRKERVTGRVRWQLPE